jgi:lipoprotein-releasing system permease protein
MNLSTIFLSLGLTFLAAVCVGLLFARHATLLLTLKYLIKRRLAWFSLVTVALLVGMVLIIFSVMGGWLGQFRSSFKTLSGDLIVSRGSQAGFAHYEQMIAAFEALPEVEAAIPLIRTAGLLYLPPTFKEFVQVVGLPPIEKTDRVLNFTESLWLQNDIAAFSESGKPQREPASFKLWEGLDYAELNPGDQQAARRNGMILGAAAIGVRTDRETGKPRWPLEMETIPGRLTVLPSDASVGSASMNAATTPYWIVDGSRTQAPQHDNNVYVPFEQLQKDLNLVAYEFEDVRTGKVMTEPARTTEIQIKLRPDIDRYAAKAKVEDVLVDVLRLQSGVDATTTRPTRGPDGLYDSLDTEGMQVDTWDEHPRVAPFLNAVENEITIMMTLFGLVSIVASFLIFCIFYTIVTEKTRDIGILKAVGGSAWHVAQMFLTYGAAIGVVGGGLGVVLGTLFVTYINEINTTITRVTGREIYSGAVYAIDKLPNEVDPKAAVIIWMLAVLMATVGALVPAIFAGRLNTVDALRFE